MVYLTFGVSLLFTSLVVYSTLFANKNLDEHIQLLLSTKTSASSLLQTMLNTIRAHIFPNILLIGGGVLGLVGTGYLISVNPANSPNEGIGLLTSSILGIGVAAVFVTFKNVKTVTNGELKIWQKLSYISIYAAVMVGYFQNEVSSLITAVAVVGGSLIWWIGPLKQPVKSKIILGYLGLVGAILPLFEFIPVVGVISYSIIITIIALWLTRSHLAIGYIALLLIPLLWTEAPPIMDEYSPLSIGLGLALGVFAGILLRIPKLASTPNHICDWTLFLGVPTILWSMTQLWMPQLDLLNGGLLLTIGMLINKFGTKPLNVVQVTYPANLAGALLAIILAQFTVATLALFVELLIVELALVAIWQMGKQPKTIPLRALSDKIIMAVIGLGLIGSISVTPWIGLHPIVILVNWVISSIAIKYMAKAYSPLKWLKHIIVGIWLVYLIWLAISTQVSGLTLIIGAVSTVLVTKLSKTWLKVYLGTSWVVLLGYGLHTGFSIDLLDMTKMALLLWLGTLPASIRPYSKWVGIPLIFSIFAIFKGLLPSEEISKYLGLAPLVASAVLAYFWLHTQFSGYRAYSSLHNIFWKGTVIILGVLVLLSGKGYPLGHLGNLGIWGTLILLWLASAKTFGKISVITVSISAILAIAVSLSLQAEAPTRIIMGILKEHGEVSVALAFAAVLWLTHAANHNIRTMWLFTMGCLIVAYLKWIMVDMEGLTSYVKGINLIAAGIFGAVAHAHAPLPSANKAGLPP